MQRFAEASALLASVRDIIDERPDGDVIPSWCARRGWTGFCASLSDDDVRDAERDGLAARIATRADAPRDLADLARDVLRLTALPVSPQAHLPEVDGRRASPRKRAQVAAFAALVAPLASGSSRVVDLGSGHGHLTRHLAHTLQRPAVGWERDPARVAVASSLVGDTGARFIVADARALADTLTPDDLVVGLHACGELGDHAVRAAVAAGAAVALIGCCLQKRSGARAPLVVEEGVDVDALTLGCGVLGLGNARDGDEGVEDDLATRTRSRVYRDALRRALRDAGCALAPGEEMRGVNRRRATGDLAALAARAFALRGVVPPSRAALDRALDAAESAYARSRRYALPRAMLARLVEVWVALDRAALLTAAGYTVRVCEAFDARVSPRNIAIVATPPGR